MKIVGWTEWDDPNYRDRFPNGVQIDWDDLHRTEEVIAAELRNKGYKFTGDYHQNGDFGVPIFDDGTVFQCSQRTWGDIMVSAYPDEIEDHDRLGYTVWAWSPPEDMSVPNPEDYTKV